MENQSTPGLLSIKLMGDSRLPDPGIVRIKAIAMRRRDVRATLQFGARIQRPLQRSTKILAFGTNSHGGFALWITSSCMGFGMFRLTETGQACGHDNVEVLTLTFPSHPLTARTRSEANLL